VYDGVSSRSKNVSKDLKGSILKAYSRVARLEYLPAEILLVMIPILLVIKSPSEVMTLPFAEAVVVFFLLYFTGFMANALSDRKVDATYDSYKSSVARAVDVIGPSRLVRILGVQIVLALLLSFHIYLMVNNYLILVFVGIGVFLGIGYSIRPLHFKTKGLAHGLSLATSAFFLPLAFLIVVLTGGLDFMIFIFLVGFTMAMYSMEFGNQAMDHFEDRKMELRSPTVRFSVRKSMGFALALLAVGFLFMMVPLVTLALYMYHDIHPLIGDWLVVIVVTSILALGFTRPAIGLAKIFSSFSPKRAVTVRARKVTLRSVNHPGWQWSGALGVAIVCGLLFGGMFIAFPDGANAPVINTVPEVKIETNPDLIVNVGNQVGFSAEVIDDSRNLTYTWNFGDGTGWSGDYIANHTYHRVGVYNVTFTVDDGPNKVSDWMNITVTDLYFSKLDFSSKRFLTFTRVYYDFNVTNDKDLKHQDELIVKVYYLDVLVKSQGLEHKLDPAKVWQKDNYIDILDPEPTFRAILLHKVGDEQIVVEDIRIQPK